MPQAKPSLTQNRIEKDVIDSVRLCELRLSAARKLAASCGTLVVRSRNINSINLFSTRLSEEIEAVLGYYHNLKKIEKLAARRRNEIKERDMERARLKQAKENPL